MSNIGRRGKNGLGKGKGKAAYYGNGKRHAGVYKVDAVTRVVTRPSATRLARRAGIKTLSEAVIPELRDELTEYIHTVIRMAIIRTRHAKRKTVSYADLRQSIADATGVQFFDGLQ